MPLINADLPERPSPEEMERENRRLKRILDEDHDYHRFMDQLGSFALTVFIACIFSIFVLFAIVGASTIIAEMNLSSFWIGMINGFFNLGSKAVLIFIGWHFVFATYHRFQPEIDKQIKELSERYRRGTAAFNSTDKVKE